MKQMFDAAGLEKTYHSRRKSAVQTLLCAEVPPMSNDVAYWTLKNLVAELMQ